MRACLAGGPSNAEANDLMGLVQALLGDYAGGLASLSRAPDIVADPSTLADLRVAQFYNGVLTREELARHMENEALPIPLAGYLYALVDHPDPKQRDPELVLRTLAERASSLTDFRWPATVEIVARVRLEDWSGALEVFEDRFKPQYLMLLTPMSYEFLRSLIYSRLGRDVEARQSYKRGMLAWDEQTADHPAAWEHSDAMHWRRKAEAALAK